MDLNEYYLIQIGTFDQDLEDSVLASLEKARILRKRVLFLINSQGGELSAFTAIAAYIDLFQIPCDGLNMGYANSSAFFLLQKCNKRYALPGTLLCGHYGDHTFGNSVIHARLSHKKWPNKNFDDIFLGLISFVSARSGLKKKKIRKIFAQERILSTKQAKKLGFLDRVLKPNEIINGN